MQGPRLESVSGSIQDGSWQRIWLTFRRPADDVDSLGVLREGRYVVDLLAVGILFYLPQLPLCQRGTRDGSRTQRSTH